MEDSKSRFIEAATRPFADQAETRLAAKAWLETSVQGDPSRWEEAVRRWGNRKPRGSGWRIAYYGVITLVSAVIWITVSRDTLEHVRWVQSSLAPFSTPNTGSRDRVFKHLSESDKLLFSGNDEDGAVTPGKETLWQSEPENPAYFAEYARAFSRENGVTPPDYLETARRLAPANAWFTYHAAEIEAKEVATQNPDQSWTLKDPARMDRVLALLREASEQTGYESHAAEMLGRRLVLLPRRNLTESMDAVMVLASGQMSSSAFFMHLPAAISARSWLAAEAGDVEAFQQIAQDGEKFLRGLCANRVETLLNEVIIFGTAYSLSQRFADDAKKLGLANESEKWSGIYGRLSENRKQRSSRKFMLDGQPADPREYDSLTLSSALEVTSIVKSQPPLTRADLKPGSMLDHALLSRILSFATWILMALGLAATALYRFRVSAMHRGLARRAVELLDARDGAWIAGAGVLLPFGFVMVVNHLTPLGGHGYGLRATGLLLPAVHFLGWWLLWFTVPPQIIRWRLAKRAGVMALPKASWLGWGMTVIAFTFAPLAGWAAVSRSFASVWEKWVLGFDVEIVTSAVSPVRFWLAAGLALILTSGFLIRALASLLRTRSLMPATASSLVLTPVFAGTLLIAALAIPAFQASGQSWFDQDPMIKADPAMPGWTAYEAKIAAQARKELQEALGDR